MEVVSDICTGVIGCGHAECRQGRPGECGLPAFDFTFSAPKSVSVLYALGDTRVVAAVEAAHTDAVLQAVGSLSLKYPGFDAVRVYGFPALRARSC